MTDAHLVQAVDTLDQLYSPGHQALRRQWALRQLERLEAGARKAAINLRHHHGDQFTQWTRYLDWLAHELNVAQAHVPLDELTELEHLAVLRDHENTEADAA